MSVIRLMVAYVTACVAIAFLAGIGVTALVARPVLLQGIQPSTPGSVVWALLDQAGPKLMLVLALTCIAALFGLRQMVRWAKRPLDGFREQIVALSEGRFVSIPEPTVSEWVTLSKAINVMVARVQLAIADKDQRIDSLKDELGVDALTGVASRVVFIDRLKQELQGRGAAPGAVVMVRVHDLVGMNQRAGRERTDEFLRAVATILRTRLYQLKVDSTVLARMNGSDFGLLLPTVTSEVLENWLDSTASAIQGLYTDQIAESPTVAWMGGSTYDLDESLSNTLTRVDTMLMAAETHHKPYAVTIPGKQHHTVAVAQWRTVIDAALDSGRIGFTRLPVARPDQTIVHYLTNLKVVGPDGADLPSDLVIPPAIRSGRVMHIDLRLIELALSHMKEHEGDLAVNIAAQSIKHPFFLRRLRELLSAAGDDTRRLWFELSEIAAAESTHELTRLIDLLHEFGCRIGISQFGTHLSALPRLKNRRINYVKLDASYCVGIAADPSLQSFVRLLTTLAADLQMLVFSSGVKDPGDSTTLTALGVHAAERY